MPILDLQKGLRQLGRIRAGEKRTTAQGKEFPSKLTNWRLTSASFEYLAAAAELYGGEVGRWEGAPTEGEQFELYTTTDRLPIYVPPGDVALSQWYEMWNAGGCVRRCDGYTEQLSAGPCQCPPDHDARSAAASSGKACKMTTRLNVLLPDLPDIGLWMLESHGYYAAVELAGAHEILQLAAERKMPIPAQLRLDQRTVKRPKANGQGVETRHYVVPVIEMLSITAGMLMTGEKPALGNGNAAALPAPSARAIDAPRVAARTDAPEAKATANGGPPMPPLPHEQDPAVPPNEAAGRGEAAGTPPAQGPAARPVNRVAIAAREAGLDDDGRHDLAAWASGHRTRSSAELTDDEQAKAIVLAKRIKSGEVRLVMEGEVLEARDSRFGWPAQEEATTPPTLAVEVAVMSPLALNNALRERGLPVDGSGDDRRQRLVDAMQSEPF